LRSVEALLLRDLGVFPRSTVPLDLPLGVLEQSSGSTLFISEPLKERQRTQGIKKQKLTGGPRR
jgi:hypothetical protein